MRKEEGSVLYARGAMRFRIGPSYDRSERPAGEGEKSSGVELRYEHPGAFYARGGKFREKRFRKKERPARGAHGFRRSFTAERSAGVRRTALFGA